jgi:hypothetical protein
MENVVGRQLVLASPPRFCDEASETFAPVGEPMFQVSAHWFAQASTSE